MKYYWNGQRNMLYLEMDYNNSYASRKKTTKSKEVLIMNYEV
jgi:hypothetical protein